MTDFERGAEAFKALAVKHFKDKAVEAVARDDLRKPQLVAAIGRTCADEIERIPLPEQQPSGSESREASAMRENAALEQELADAKCQRTDSERALANMQAERDGLALALARANGKEPPRRRCKKCGQLTGNPHLPKCPRRARALAPDARPSPSSEKQRGDKT